MASYDWKGDLSLCILTQIIPYRYTVTLVTITIIPTTETIPLLTRKYFLAQSTTFES